MNITSLSNIDWKGFVKGPFFIVIVAALAFLGGRYTTPEHTKIVTVDKVVEVHHESTQVVQQLDIDKLLKQVQDKTKFVDRDVVRLVTIKPDGTKIETETDHSHIDTQQHTDTTNETKTTQLTDIKKVLDDYRAEEHSKTVVINNSKNWRVGVLGGYGYNASGLITGVPGLIVGAFAERKIIGPLNAGLWATSQPGAGLQLSVSF
jgi:hypothetical protein